MKINDIIFDKKTKEKLKDINKKVIFKVINFYENIGK